MESLATKTFADWLRQVFDHPVRESERFLPFPSSCCRTCTLKTWTATGPSEVPWT